MPDLLSAAQAALGQGQLAEAASLCQRVLSQDAANPSALLVLGLCSRQAGDLPRAEATLRQAAAAAGDAAEVLNALGLVVAEQGRFDEAMALYRRALAVNPAYAKAHNNLGNACKDRGRPADSLAHYRRALELAPDYAEAHYNHGNALKELARFEEAAAAYRRCLALAPQVFEAYVGLGVALQALGRPQEAFDALQQAARLRPQEPEVQAGLGDLAVALDRLETAQAHYGAALAATGEERFRRRYRRLAMAHLERGDYRAASASLIGQLRLLADADGCPIQRSPRRETSPIKLRHDVEQLAYLRERGLLPARYRDALAACESALANLPSPDANNLVTLPADLAAAIAPVESRLVHYAEAPPLAAGAVNPGLDGAAIGAAFAQTVPGIACIDDFLTEEALGSLRRFCLESTIWWQLEHTHEVGTSLINGFCCPLLLQIAAEARRALPAILGETPFVTVWAYKYYPEPGPSSAPTPSSGLDVHADDGAVSINFWITPDAANLEREGGGMTFWNAAAPDSYFVTKTRAERLAIVAPLHAAAGPPVIRFPHRANRAIVFRSNTLHCSEQYRFREDYESRRISITMAFGRRGNAASSSM